MKAQTLRQGAADPGGAAVSSTDQKFLVLLDSMARNKSAMENQRVLQQYAAMLESVCGREGNANALLLRHLLMCRAELDKLRVRNEKLAKFAEGLKAQKPLLARVLSSPFNAGEICGGQQMVYAVPLGDRSSAPQCFAMAAIPEDGPEQRETTPELPAPPYLGLIEPVSRSFLGPASALPNPPTAAELYEVVASYPADDPDTVSEIEVRDALSQKDAILPASLDLARTIQQKLQEEGEAVTVRAEYGVATAVHTSSDREHEDWLEFLSTEGPRVSDLLFEPELGDAFRRDIRHLASGRGLRVLLVGPTGTGKTSAVERMGRDALDLATKKGRPMKGCALIRLSGPHIGSSLIHQTSINLRKALKKAKNLAERGYIVVVLCDEADALLGVFDGVEHNHSRSERLNAQELLSKDLDGVAVYLTMNPRRNSWLPSAIERRFRPRVYPPPTRRQLAAVAVYYAGQRPNALEVLGMTDRELGCVFADYLYADRQIVAVCHMHSADKIPVRIRDLHICTPGKAEGVIDVFLSDIEDGEANSLEQLWPLLDREFRAPCLNIKNLYDSTFLKASPHDTVRSLELVR